VRLLLILIGSVGAALLGYLLIYWHAYRSAMRAEMSYNAEQERLYADFERRLRDEINAFQRANQSNHSQPESTDHLFEMLETSEIAANSREVDRWRRVAESPERRAIALKWAQAAADQAAYKSELHRRWRLDYERGKEPHHIPDLEVKPPAMPEGWTSDDLKWRHD
jgi:hypothetical protein